VENSKPHYIMTFDIIKTTIKIFTCFGSIKVLTPYSPFISIKKYYTIINTQKTQEKNLVA
jgi:hypothetical protein